MIFSIIYPQKINFMAVKILQFSIIVFILFPSLLFSQNSLDPVKNEAQNLHVSEVQKRKISASEFLLLPEEKKLHIRNNPNLYVLDESINVVLQRPIRHRIKRAEYDSMPVSRKAHIDANLDKYEIVD
jgi:hypothetical protein